MIREQRSELWTRQLMVQDWNFTLWEKRENVLVGVRMDSGRILSLEKAWKSAQSFPSFIFIFSESEKRNFIFRRNAFGSCAPTAADAEREQNVKECSFYSKWFVVSSNNVRQRWLAREVSLLQIIRSQRKTFACNSIAGWSKFIRKPELITNLVLQK